MGVSHLHSHAAKAAQAKSASDSYPDSNITMPGNVAGKPGGTAAPNKGKGSSVGYSAEALRGLKAPAQPAHGGARLGQKSGQPKLGKKAGGVLGKVFPNGNAGRAK